MSDELFKPGWLDDQLRIASRRNFLRTIKPHDAWREGYLAGLWYGKSGQKSDNPYEPPRYSNE